MKDFSEVLRNKINILPGIKSYGVGGDDFGAGYANFKNILQLKADWIKIDSSLIKILIQVSAEKQL